LIYGLALILVMLYRPKGIWPEKNHHGGEVKS
jgi:ABC-type branched-subunit amino acid transport system permease subunit